MLLVLLMALSQAQPDVPDGDQFLRLVAGLHEEIRDVSFTCEGEIKRVGPERITGEPPDGVGRKFQAGYSYRRDGATLIDAYQRDGTPGADVVRVRTSYLRGELEELGLAPGAAPRGAKPDRTKGASGSLNMSGSPHRILLLWYFRELAESTYRAEPRRWEDLDGRRCLVVEVVATGPTVAKVVDRLWIDLERGGHPLRFEQYRNDELRMRTEIRLAGVPSGGREYWLPVAGVTETFQWQSKLHAEPIYRETYQVVGGSVVVNAGLGDGAFSTAKVPSKGGPGAEGELARQFRETPPEPEPQRQRTDAEGVRERLDAELAEAERQSTMLEASAPSRDWWSWTGLFQGLGVVAGLGLLGVAILLRGRQGG